MKPRRGGGVDVRHGSHPQPSRPVWPAAARSPPSQRRGRGRRAAASATARWSPPGPGGGTCVTDRGRAASAVCREENLRRSGSEADHAGERRRGWGAGNTGARRREKPRGVRNEHGAWALRLVNGVGNEKMANAKNDSEFGKYCRLVVYCQPVLVCVYMCVRAYMCARACCICVCGGVRG